MKKFATNVVIKQPNRDMCRACYVCSYAEIVDSNMQKLYCRIHSMLVYNTATCALWTPKSDASTNCDWDVPLTSM